tara:strand:- start:17745 stop:18041 length:297 start_codon:yes stop_codon:yes gene_type:complete
MKKHTKIYMDAFGYDECDFMPCEITGSKGVDIHHIVNRENRIENLMLLTREKHAELGEIKHKMAFLLLEHRLFLYNNGVKFEEKWFEKEIKKYRPYAN